jgi:hypothetical protein
VEPQVSDALDAVVELLNLEQIEADIFRGRSPREHRQRVFGGQVAGQALVAAGRTVPADRPVHSLHAYFIRPGDPSVPLIYLVDRVRDGRSFTTRRVSAIQHGRAIFTLSASFHHAEPGPEHARAMPEVPPPESLLPMPERLARVLGGAAAGWPGRSRSRRRRTRRCGPAGAWYGSGPTVSCRTTRCWWSSVIWHPGTSAALARRTAGWRVAPGQAGESAGGKICCPRAGRTRRLLACPWKADAARKEVPTVYGSTVRISMPGIRHAVMTSGVMMRGTAVPAVAAAVGACPATSMATGTLASGDGLGAAVCLPALTDGGTLLPRQAQARGGQPRDWRQGVAMQQHNLRKFAYRDRIATLNGAVAGPCPAWDPV